MCGGRIDRRGIWSVWDSAGSRRGYYPYPRRRAIAPVDAARLLYSGPMLAEILADLTPEALLRHALRERAMEALDALTASRVEACTGPECAAAARQLAVRRALEEFSLDVQEPPGRNWHRIGAYICGSGGLGWPSAALPGSVSTRQYTRNGQFAWCGAFAAWCWEHVAPAVRLARFASCSRLEVWSRGTARRIAPSDLLPGDLAIVGPAAPGSGAHIVVVIEAPTNGIVATVEGNATGPGPDGIRREGVIRRQRPLAAPDPRIYRVHYGVRPLADDLM